MDIGTIGLLIIAFAVLSAIASGVARHLSNKDAVISVAVDDNERLEQLISCSGGGSLAQLIRLYNIRGKQLKECESGCSHTRFQSLVRDHILLSKEIGRLTYIAAENESSLLIQHICR